MNSDKLVEIKQILEQYEKRRKQMKKFRILSGVLVTIIGLILIQKFEYYSTTISTGAIIGGIGGFLLALGSFSYNK